MKYDFSIFCDCGAPSLYNKLSRKTNTKGIMGSTFKERKFDDFSYTETSEYKKYRDAYIEFLHLNEGKINVYSNLDVINNPKLTEENQRILESNGLHPIPVYHLGSPEKWLRKLLNRYDYIAIGGLIPNPTDVLLPWLDGIFKNYILDEKGYPRVKTHGFACTAMPLATRYPWYSVDSATARKLAMYGWIALPEWNGSDLKTVQISSRVIVDKDKERMTGLFEMGTVPRSEQISPQTIANIEKWGKIFGSTYQQLCDSIIERVVWNYIVYRTVIHERVTNWPWRNETPGDFVSPKIPKKGATEQMIMYMAGSLSKKEEEIFWEAISKKNDMDLAKGRLQSFFYRGNVEHIISLKHG